LYLRTADSAASMEPPVKVVADHIHADLLVAAHHPCTAAPMPSTGLELL
jgi:hypothetical protein